MDSAVMDTPAVTPTQYGAGGLFAAVALACVTTGITGSDLLAYLASSALVTIGLVASDAVIRKGRAGVAIAQVVADTKDAG